MAVVHHLGLDPELENINPTKGETQTPEFIAINPNGKIPTLQDGDFTLWESQAIMRYLAEKHESDLVPSELSQKALMDQWLCWNIAHFTPAVGGVVWERLAPQIIEGYQPDERQLAKSLENLARFAPILDKHLEDREFVLSNHSEDKNKGPNTKDDMSEIISICLLELSDEFKTMIIFRDFQELSYDVISNIMRIPIGTVKSRINRGRFKLLKLLKEKGYYK